jgi:sporulation protein YlmC with PRC-barrel domain
MDYERAEPRIVVNQPQGQPQVRMEQADREQRPDQQARTQPAGAQQPAPAAGGQTIAVSRINAMKLYNDRGDQLGDVERVVQGPDGKQHVVIGAGGFLGIGERQVAIPVERVAVQGDRLVVQGMTEAQIKAQPPFDRNNRTFRELERDATVQVVTR